MKEQFIVYCENVLDLRNASLSDEFYYQSLPLCLIDSVFSINVRYTSVKNVLKRYSMHYDLPLFRSRDSSYPSIESQHTISELHENMKKYGVEDFARYIFQNNCRTSSRAGILKAEAVYLWAKTLMKYDINAFQDVSKLSDEIEAEVRTIKGQGTGITWNYFRMLSGDDSFCKPDRQLLRFISSAMKRNISDVSEAQEVMNEAVGYLIKSYPNMTVRLLDHTIWKHMSKGGSPCTKQ